MLSTVRASRNGTWPSTASAASAWRGQDLDPLVFIRDLNGLDVWPPVFPLLEVPAFLLAGPGYPSARGLVALLFMAAIAAAFWSGLQSGQRSGFAVGALTAALIATSPMAQVFAALVMLEIPGTLLLLLAVGFYLRSLTTGRARDFSLACVAATVLFFCKYNYGLIWILPMVAHELLRAHGWAALRCSAIMKGPSSVLLGTRNHLSPWLVEWSCLQRRPSMDPGQVPRELTARSRRGNVLGRLAADPPELLMVLSTAPGSQPRPGFAAETRWLDPVRKQLVRDPRFDLVSRKDFPDACYRLEGFESTRTGREPVPR